MTRRRRVRMALACGTIVLVLALLAIHLNRESSPVGVWSLAEATEWIEFSAQKNEDFFAPSHDGTWIRHRGKDTAEGMWVRVPGDRHRFDMITHVSGPMWVKDGRLTLSRRSGEWKQGFSDGKVEHLTWQSADVPSSKKAAAKPVEPAAGQGSSTSPVQF